MTGPLTEQLKALNPPTPTTEELLLRQLTSEASAALITKNSVEEAILLGVYNGRSFPRRSDHRPASYEIDEHAAWRVTTWPIGEMYERRLYLIPELELLVENSSMFSEYRYALPINVDDLARLHSTVYNKDVWDSIIQGLRDLAAR